jgi:hypothetical protein
LHGSAQAWQACGGQLPCRLGLTRRGRPTI